MNILLIGPPGSGKGTQANLLCQKYGLINMSIGDMLRNEVQGKTSIGLKVESCMKDGKLVSDAIVIEIIKENLARKDICKGFVLDGFPRNKDQASELEAILKKLKREINLILVFDVDELELKRRLINRIYCKSCKATSSKEDSLVDFNKKNKIKCRSCGSESGFFSRSDDNHHAISERLKQDKILSNFVKEFYNKKYPEKTFYIDASKHPSSVNLEVESAVFSISNLKKN